MTQLPIEMVPNSHPPRFRWKYVVDTPGGKRVVDQESAVQPSMEVVLQRLISIAKTALMDNAGLHAQVNKLTEKNEQLGARIVELEADAEDRPTEKVIVRVQTSQPTASQTSTGKRK